MLSEQLKSLDYTTIRTRRKVDYINLPCGFDIETTSTMVGEDKVAFMYVWMLGIGDGSPVIYGNTWEEAIAAFDLITTKLELSESKRIVFYVHNLGYEFQFMRKYFEWIEIFAISDRKPIKATTKSGIEFRDSYILSGFSLANTAKNLVSHTIKKAEGDLDYSLIRHHETPLTEAEIGYCDSDIDIITAYIQEQIDYYGDVTKIPMTNTGRVRSYVRNECYYKKSANGRNSKSHYFRYRRIMEDLTLDVPTYIQLKRGFMGGFTHANANHSNKTLENVTSIDFTSAYPSVMVAERFPMSKFKEVHIESLEQLETMCGTYAVIFDVRFTNIRSKLTQETYMSHSKCSELANPVLNNGRVASADIMATTITDVDFDIMKQCYDWDELQIGVARYATKDYLPKAIVKSILDLYQDKTELKDVEGSEVEYLLSKGMLNSIYGMSVTDIVKDNALYGLEDEEVEQPDWFTEKVCIESEVSDYNESKNRFLYYPWGLWVTAYARKNLWTGIIAVGNDYVYSDTDSLKIMNYEKHKPYIEWFDAGLIKKMKAMCKHYKFNPKLLEPATKDGVTKMLGIWDYEGTYPLFKTLGAKRYLVLDKDRQGNPKLELTVAGLSKQNGINYMKDMCGDLESVFDMFTDELYIPADRTGKMTHTYIDNEYKFKVTDYLGNEATVEVLSGIHLESCDFTLSISEQYQQFMKSLSQGYIYNGVKHV